jgi:hypothetical protein
MRGWTHSVRPPGEFTRRLKRAQLRAWGCTDRRLGHYEEDHLIPLGLGGAPADEQNLWPEPRQSVKGWTAAQKDELEDQLHRLVCNRLLPLSEVQRAIAGNWIEAHRRYVGE